MYLLYSLAFTVTFLALLPFFIYQVLTHGKYAASFKERLGLVPIGPRSGRPVIWVHAVSVGEFLAAQPLIRRLAAELPEYAIVLSTTTLAGQTLARSRMSGDDCISGEESGAGQLRPEAHCTPARIFYFPFDWRLAVRRALDRINPASVIIMETEIWPNFLDECRSRGIATIIANGRLSERSFSRYRIASRFMRRVLGSLTMLLMQTDADRSRAILLGANPDRVQVCGNLKYDAALLQAAPTAAPGPGIETSIRSALENRAREISRTLHLDGPQPLIVAGSTTAGEEEILLAAFARVVSAPGLQATRMIIGPRRPERFDEVARIIAGCEPTIGGGWIRRSAITASVAEQFTERHASDSGTGSTDLTFPADNNSGREEGLVPALARLILLDSIGELAGIYQFATVVFVGGSLVPHGGHNILEPAAFAKPIVVGPYTGNFAQIVKDFVSGGGLIQIEDRDRQAQTAALAAQWIRLLTDQDTAQALGLRAFRVLEANRGATTRTVAAIRSAIRQGGI